MNSVFVCLSVCVCVRVCVCVCVCLCVYLSQGSTFLTHKLTRMQHVCMYTRTNTFIHKHAPLGCGHPRPSERETQPPAHAQHSPTPERQHKLYDECIVSLPVCMLFLMPMCQRALAFLLANPLPCSHVCATQKFKICPESCHAQPSSPICMRAGVHAILS